MKKVLITGATSMLGSALTKVCVQNGVEVLAFLRKNTGKRGTLPASPLVTVYECEMSEYKSFRAQVPPCDVFYHFAWEGADRENRNNVPLQLQNATLCLDALRLAHRLGCRRFLFAGTQAEYGRVQGTISEAMRGAPENAYGMSKFYAGSLCAILAEQLGMEYLRTRIFSTYGKNDMPSTMIMYCIDMLLKGMRPSLTPCIQEWDYLYSHDAAKAFFALGTSGKSGQIYNIGSGQARPLLEYVETLRDAIDPSLPLGIGEIAYAPRQVMHLCADISLLSKDTGFTPSTPFAEGIRQTITWYKERQKQ